MQFFKYQGAGNDFIMLDQRQRQLLGRGDTQQIAFLCDRHFGIGADGLILLQNHSALDFEMVYFNADGRESTMCGNGGRCIAAFAKHLGIPGDAQGYRFMAIDGEHRATLPYSTGPGGEWVELKMNDVNRIEQVMGADCPAFILNTGSPHFVRFVPDTEMLNVKQEGRAVRYSERFEKEGINVNFAREKEGRLLIRTYERGVEDETLACGTGVTAAAIASFIDSKKSPGRQEIPVRAKGGDLLVRFMAHGDGSFTDIWLCGPAQKVFQGNIEI
ncbi:MAG: diaminopimelate epimerase [Thermoanaerobaculia bacterium]|nr:diaminopimelate epimerase [Thermoanaerobaculia bacterium]